jgi:hypothetical protein
MFQLEPWLFDLIIIDFSFDCAEMLVNTGTYSILPTVYLSSRSNRCAAKRSMESKLQARGVKFVSEESQDKTLGGSLLCCILERGL